MESLSAGYQIGDYEIIEQIGEGGMGQVYLAQHVFLKKRFAVKVLPEEFTENETFVKVFQQEGQTLASLKHENITTVHNFGVQDNMYFLVMDYVSGGTIEDYRLQQANHCIAPQEVLHTLMAVVAGLEHAHEVGIVHRDLKPENFLIDKDGTVKISDFGISQFCGITDNLTHAKPNTIVHLANNQKQAGNYVGGTEGYMAPELSETGVVDHRADFYSLGVIAYFLLTGKKPGMHSARASTLVPRLPKLWDKIIEKCVSYSPEKRYQSASELQLDLQRLEKKYKVKRAGYSFLSGVLVLIAIAGASSWYFFKKPATSESTTSSPAQVAEEKNPTQDKEQEMVDIVEDAIIPTIPVIEEEEPTTEPTIENAGDPAPIATTDENSSPVEPIDEEPSKPIRVPPAEIDITTLPIPSIPTSEQPVTEKESVPSQLETEEPDSASTPTADQDDEFLADISLRVFDETDSLLTPDQYQVYVNGSEIEFNKIDRNFQFSLAPERPTFVFEVQADGYQLYYRKFSTPTENKSASLEIILTEIEDTFEYYSGLLKEFLPRTEWQVLHRSEKFPFEKLEFRSSGFIRVDGIIQKWTILEDGNLRLAIDDERYLVDFDQEMEKLLISSINGDSLTVAIKINSSLRR